MAGSPAILVVCAFVVAAIRVDEADTLLLHASAGCAGGIVATVAVIAVEEGVAIVIQVVAAEKFCVVAGWRLRRCRWCGRHLGSCGCCSRRHVGSCGCCSRRHVGSCGCCSRWHVGSCGCCGRRHVGSCGCCGRRHVGGCGCCGGRHVGGCGCCGGRHVGGGGCRGRRHVGGSRSRGRRHVGGGRRRGRRHVGGGRRRGRWQLGSRRGWRSRCCRCCWRHWGRGLRWRAAIYFAVELVLDPIAAEVTTA